MKKSDLKVGYVVKLRNGKYCMVLPTTNGLCISGPDSYFSFNRITENLECNGLFGSHLDAADIVEVYGLARFNDDASKFGPNYRDLLWRREEKPAAKKMTVKEICGALGYEVEIVKDGADQ